MIAPARQYRSYLDDVPPVSGALRNLAHFDAAVAEDDLGPDCLNAVDLSEPAEPSPRVRRLIAREIRDAGRRIRAAGPKFIDRRHGPPD